MTGLLAGALILAGAGCTAKKTKVVPVQGIIRLNGEPLAGAGVLFSPVGDGLPASGVTKDDGTFRLSCGRGDGALPGEYKVAITPPPETPSPPEGQGLTPQDRMQAMLKKMIGQGKRISEASKKKQRTKTTLPSVFQDINTTPLRQTVPPPDGKVVLSLEGQ